MRTRARARRIGGSQQYLSIIFLAILCVSLLANVRHWLGSTPSSPLQSAAVVLPQPLLRSAAAALDDHHHRKKVAVEDASVVDLDDHHRSSSSSYTTRRPTTTPPNSNGFANEDVWLSLGTVTSLNSLAQFNEKDQIGEWPVMTTLSMLAMLLKVEERASAKRDCPNYQDVMVNQSPLLIIDIGANVGMFSWQLIRDLAMPVAKWAGNEKIGTTSVRGALFAGARSLEVHMVEPDPDNVAIIRAWATPLVRGAVGFGLGPAKSKTATPGDTGQSGRCTESSSGSAWTKNMRVNGGHSVYTPNTGVYNFEPTLRVTTHVGAISTPELAVRGKTSFNTQNPSTNGEGGKEIGRLCAEGTDTSNCVDVAVTSVDRLWKAVGVAKGHSSIFVLKVDVEGFEADVFDGMKTVLKERRAEFIFFEISDSTLLRKVVPTLKENAYDVFLLSRKGLLPIYLTLASGKVVENKKLLGTFGWKNAFAMQNNHRLKPLLLTALLPTATRSAPGNPLRGGEYVESSSRNVLGPLWSSETVSSPNIGTPAANFLGSTKSSGGKPGGVTVLPYSVSDLLGWELVPTKGGAFYMKSEAGGYLSAHHNGVVSLSVAPNPWEEWLLRDPNVATKPAKPTDASFLLVSAAHKTYLTTDDAGSARMIALDTRTSGDTWYSKPKPLSQGSFGKTTNYLRLQQK